MTEQPADELLGLTAYATAFEQWLSHEPPTLVAARAHRPVFGQRVEAMSALMRALSDHGWALYGWPTELGGRGGTIMHRAVMWDALARHGVPSMTVFEHVEVLLPTLVELGPPEFVADVLPQFLAGEVCWAQGFSEPDAGSDMAALRTRAEAVEGGYRINGRKIWTSWAGYATWCLVLARTGTTESRHRGITAFIVDLRDPRVEVSAIVQANGTDELAEVVFDEVFVPTDRIVGALDGGWAVAMHILSSERGTYGWFRHGFLYQFLFDHLDLGGPENDEALGSALIDLVALTAATHSGVRSHEAGELLGPHATLNKLMLCNAEQSVCDWVYSGDADLAVAPQDEAIALRRQEYLFSKIVTVYGGSQQMQLETIAKQVLRLP